MAGEYSYAEHAIRSEFAVYELIVKVHSSCYGVSCRSQASYSDENAIRSEIGVHEPLEKLIQAEEEASGKGSVKFRMNVNVKSKRVR